MSTITYTAADELDRRATNRALKAQGLKGVPGPRTPEGARLLGMSAAELRAEAGVEAPVRQARTPQAPKRQERTAEQVAATEARKLAWAWRLEQRQAGVKVTYAEACARFGTVPAKG
jgi:hypothetical protein